MHEYAQILLERAMASRVGVATRNEAFNSGFVEWVFDSATPCACGCGKRAIPKSISQAISAFKKTESVIYSKSFLGHGKMTTPADFVPSYEQHQAILASILGDGSLLFPYKTSNSSPRLVWNMGNYKHAKYKKDFFSFLGASLSTGENPGYGNEWHRVVTKSHKFLKKYHDLCYVGTRVTPTYEIISQLDAIGWAWLYGDDGHFDKKGKIAFIHTESFTLDEVNIFKECLDEFVGFDCSEIHSYKQSSNKRLVHSLRMRKNGTYQFIQKIGKHMAHGMEYKTGGFYIPD